jgi:hypothetical protein
MGHSPVTEQWLTGTAGCGEWQLCFSAAELQLLAVGEFAPPVGCSEVLPRQA